MAKEKTYKGDDNAQKNKGVGEKANNVLAKEKLINITFRENRKFDLHIGTRILITFGPRETKPIPVSYLKHRDFAQAKKYFIIKGV